MTQTAPRLRCGNWPTHHFRSGACTRCGEVQPTRAAKSPAMSERYDPLAAGWDAFQKGHRFDQCPYMDDAAAQWEQGWKDAREDALRRGGARC